MRRFHLSAISAWEVTDMALPAPDDNGVTVYPAASALRFRYPKRVSRRDAETTYLRFGAWTDAPPEQPLA